MKEFKFYKEQSVDMAAMAVFVGELVRQGIEFIVEHRQSSTVFVVIITGGY